MSELVVSVEHKLTREEALSRVQGRIVALLCEHKDYVTDPRVTWNGHSGDFEIGIRQMGSGIAGTIVVHDDRVVLTGALPMMMSFFRGPISDAIRKDIETCLG